MAYKCGYSGGLGGTPFDDLHAVSAAGGQSMIQRLLRIRVYWGLYIDLIITTYQVVSGPFGQLNVQNGGNGGGYYPDIPMGGDEFIIGIYGTFGNYVDSITQIKTNLKNNVLTNTIGEGGGTGQFSFEAQFPTQAILGFHGRSGVYVDAIGVYLGQAILGGPAAG